MTHSDFNHLLSSIKGLSPEQMRQLRQQLDSQLAQPKKPAAPAPGKAAKRAKPAQAKEAADGRRASIGDCSRQAASPRCPIPPSTSTTTIPTIAGPHQGRAAVGNHPPRAALRWRPPTSSIPAPWSNAMSVETGTAWVRGITRRRPSTHIYIALITAVEVTSAVARRRGVTLSRRAGILDPLAVPQAPGRAIYSPRRSRPPW